MFVIDIGRSISGFANFTVVLVRAAVFLMPFLFLALLGKSLYITLFSPYFIVPVLAAILLVATIWMFKQRKKYKKLFMLPAVMCTLVMVSSIYFGQQLEQTSSLNKERSEKLIAALHRDYVLNYEALWPQELQDWRVGLELLSGTSPPREGYQIGTQYNMHTMSAPKKGAWYKVSPPDAIERYQELAVKHGDWLQFANDCLRAKNQTGLRGVRSSNCKSWDSVKKAYNIDVPERMALHMKKQGLSLKDCYKSEYFCARLEAESGIAF